MSNDLVQRVVIEWNEKCCSVTNDSYYNTAWESHWTVKPNTFFKWNARNGSKNRCCDRSQSECNSYTVLINSLNICKVVCWPEQNSRDDVKQHTSWQHCHHVLEVCNEFEIDLAQSFLLIIWWWVWAISNCFWFIRFGGFSRFLFLFMNFNNPIQSCLTLINIYDIREITNQEKNYVNCTASNE